MDCRRRSAIDDDRSRRIRLVVDNDRRRGRWAVDDDRSRIAFYQAQVKASLDRVDKNLNRIDKNLRSIRRLRMPATIPTPSSSLLTSASRDRKRFRNQPIMADDYPPLELPLRWHDPPPLQWRDPPPDPLFGTQPVVVAHSFHPMELPILRASTPVPSIQPDRAHDLPQHSNRAPPPPQTTATDSRPTQLQSLLPMEAATQDRPISSSHDSASDINFTEGEQFADSAIDTLHDHSPLPLSSRRPMPDSAVEAMEKPFYEIGDEKNPASPNHPLPPLIYSPLPLSSCDPKPTSIKTTSSDSNNGNKGLVGEPAYMETPLIPILLTVIVGEIKFGVMFHVKEEEGIPDAVIVKNRHLVEFFPKSITIQDFPGKGRIHFDCNFWVYNVTKYTDDRVYNYAYYNNLGNPDLISGLRQPVLGESHEYPYLHCGKTARPPTKTDPESESRLFSLDMNIYVLHDERFSHLVSKENM